MSDIRGKMVVITGASAGTGEAAARLLQSRGAVVVPIGGSLAKTQRVAADLGVATRNVDFTSLADVRRLSEELRRDLGAIDVLALNAGGVVASRDLTVDGIEPNLQLNAIGPWLLMQLLADRLAGGRVIYTSSRTHVGAKVDPDHLDDIEGLGWHGVYARAKLVGGVLLREFGRRNPDVAVADFHPGIIASDMGRYMGRLGSVLKFVSKYFIRTPQDGAKRLAYLASTDAALGGQYYMDDKPARGSPMLNDPDLALRVWARAEKLACIR